MDTNMIEARAFVCVKSTTQTTMGVVVAHSDPTATFGAFVTKAADGTLTYTSWATIIAVTIFPLGNGND